MSPIQPVGHAEDPCQLPDDLLIFLLQASELGMLEFGVALAVIAGDLGDQLDFPVGKPGQVLRVADNVAGVVVVLSVGNKEADVVENGGSLQIFPVLIVREWLWRGEMGSGALRKILSQGGGK